MFCGFVPVRRKTVLNHQLCERNNVSSPNTTSVGVLEIIPPSQYGSPSTRTEGNLRPALEINILKLCLSV